MWLMLWPVIFWAVAAILAGAISYIRCKLDMPRAECLLSVILVFLNSVMIVLLSYQWVSYENDFDKLNKQHPNIINTQRIVSQVMFISFIGLYLICCGRYIFTKRAPSHFNHHADNSTIQLLFCAFAVSSAWILTYPSSQAKEGQADFRDLLKTGKYKELQINLRDLANLHIALMIFAWPLFFAGLYGFARGVYTLHSRIWDCLGRTTYFRRRMSALVYSPCLSPRSEHGNLGAESFSNPAVVSDLRLPPPAFLGNGKLSPSLTSIDIFDIGAPQTTPCPSVYRV